MSANNKREVCWGDPPSNEFECKVKFTSWDHWPDDVEIEIADDDPENHLDFADFKVPRAALLAYAQSQGWTPPADVSPKVCSRCGEEGNLRAALFDGSYCSSCFKFLSLCQDRRGIAIRAGLKFYPAPAPRDAYLFPVSANPFEDRFMGGSDPDSMPHGKGTPRAVRYHEELWNALERKEGK